MSRHNPLDELSVEQQAVLADLASKMQRGDTEPSVTRREALAGAGALGAGALLGGVGATAVTGGGAAQSQGTAGTSAAPLTKTWTHAIESGAGASQIDVPDTLAPDVLSTPDLNGIKYVTPDEHNSGTRTIQDASDELSTAGVLGKIALAPDGEYEIGSTQTIDATAVREFDGNGSTLKVTSDTTALLYQGTWTATSDADAYTISEYDAEAGPTIKGVHIHSDQTPYIGTGIKLEALMNPTVTDVHCYHLDVGVAVSSTNRVRNLNITDSNIYDSDRGIVFETGGDMHQGRIENSTISYCRVHVHFNDCEIDECHILDSHLESGTNNAGTAPENYVLADTTNNFARKVKLLNSHIEHHGDMTDYGIKVTGSNSITSWKINDNYIDTFAGAISVNHSGTMDHWQVTGNQIKTTSPSGGDLSVDLVADRIEGTAFDDNVAEDCQVTLDCTGSFNMSATSVSGNEFTGASTVTFTTSGSAGMRACSVTENDFWVTDLSGSDLPVVHVNSSSSPTYSQVSHNHIRGESGPSGSTEFVVVIESSANLFSQRVESNTIRAFNGNAEGLQVTSTSGPASGMVQDNMVNNPNNTAFDVPAGGDWTTGTTANNLNT